MNDNEELRLLREFWWEHWNGEAYDRCEPTSETAVYDHYIKNGLPLYLRAKAPIPPMRKES